MLQLQILMVHRSHDVEGTLATFCVTLTLRSRLNWVKVKGKIAGLCDGVPSLQSSFIIIETCNPLISTMNHPKLVVFRWILPKKEGSSLSLAKSLKGELVSVSHIWGKY